MLNNVLLRKYIDKSHANQFCMGVVINAGFLRKLLQSIIVLHDILLLYANCSSSFKYFPIDDKSAMEVLVNES